MKSKITPDPRLVEALPWMLFFRDGKSLGQIAKICGGRWSDYIELQNALHEIVKVEDTNRKTKST